MYDVLFACCIKFEIFRVVHGNFSKLQLQISLYEALRTLLPTSLMMLNFCTYQNKKGASNSLFLNPSKKTVERKHAHTICINLEVLKLSYEIISLLSDNFFKNLTFTNKVFKVTVRCHLRYLSFI